MRYVFIFLLGLSLPVLAVKAAQQQTPQGNHNLSSFVDRMVDVVPPCDPYKALNIPPFN